MKTLRGEMLFIISLPVLFLISLAGWRVDVFQILDGGADIVFQSPASLGHKFTTRYIHSVELTPVEDEYHVVGGKLWAWEERVRSSKAGMPSLRPRNGRYLETSEWMIYQGGRVSWHEYYYRIGNDVLGQNQVVWEPFGRRNFYEIFTGRRLTVRVVKKPFILAKFFRADELENAPMGVPLRKGPNEE